MTNRKQDSTDITGGSANNNFPEKKSKVTKIAIIIFSVIVIGITLLVCFS